MGRKLIACKASLSHVVALAMPAHIVALATPALVLALAPPALTLSLATPALVLSLAPPALVLSLATPALADQMVLPAPDEPPEIAREFRGAWVATVGNIDWPSQAGLSSERQQTELIQLLDKAAALHLNAVILQVRPACDALYDSPYEPWSEYLTGRQGKPPSPYYDPLAFAVEQAHLRGLELHAWFNPYRARVLSEDGHHASPADPRHISVTRPDLVRSYGHYLWLDPGEPEVMAHTLRVMLDVVKRYDIDAVHMDDYFYPYREALYTVAKRAAQNVHGKPLYQPFPDKVSYARFRASGGTLSLEDWRRDNVNRFIQALYKGVKEMKPWVKVGLSPFGIWKPGHPSQIKGMSQYDSIYADARKWLREGWCDYFVPQLYWPIENPDQSFPVLLSWWADQNFQGRHLWPGLFTSRVGDDSSSPWDPRQIQYQIGWTRLQKGASGHVHFSLITLANDRSHLSQKLHEAQYLDQALVPTSPWLGNEHPNKPKVNFVRDAVQARLTADWQVLGGEAPWLWTVYVRTNGKWATSVYPLERHMLTLDFQAEGKLPDALEIGAVDRLGNEGDRARFVFASPVALPALQPTPAPSPMPSVVPSLVPSPVPSHAQ